MIDFPKIKNNLVVSSNDLVHAKYDLSLWQKRVFVYAISQLERDDKTFEKIRMNVSDIIRFFKASDGWSSYNAIIEAPKSLDKTIEIPYITETGGFRYGFVKLLQNYSTPADTKTDNQYIEICFNNDLKPHLLDLKEKFLKYDIRNIIELQSTYSFRFFELLKSYEYRNSIELSIDYLRMVLEVTNTYTSYKDFKRRIIDKAREDLTKFCDITFSYEEKKASKGKKIEALIFYIQKNKPNHRSDNDDDRPASKKAQNMSDEVVPKEDKKTELITTKRDKKTEILDGSVSEDDSKEKLILELSPVVVMQFGVSLKVFIGLVEKYTEGDIKQAVQITKKAIEVGKIDSIAGFFVKAVQEHYQENNAKEEQLQKQTIAKQRAEQEEQKELEKKQNINDARKAAFLLEEKRIATLIATDTALAAEAIEYLQRTRLSTIYDVNKSLSENLQNPSINAAFHLAIKKLRPETF